MNACSTGSPACATRFRSTSRRGTGPLRVRAGRRDQAASVCRVLNGLALSWTTGQSHQIESAGLSGYIIGIFARRVQALAHRAAQRQAGPLLGAPTHVGGWIDPRVLVERAQSWAALPSRLDRLDASVALLRLAPDPGAGPRRSMRRPG